MKRLLPLLLFLGTVISYAQETTVYAEAEGHFKKGEEHFAKGLYAAAQHEYAKALELTQPSNEPEYHNLMMRSRLNHAKAAVYLNLPEGETLMLDFVRSAEPDPIAGLALLELGNYYYNAKNYDRAIDYYGRLDSRDFSGEQRSEVKFKQGYAYFVQKKFGNAITSFAKIKEVQNKYYYPSNYYYGMSQYFKGNFDAAEKSFQRVKASPKYKDHVPYYISQMYFSQGRYAELIAYAEPLVGDPSIKKQKEMGHLLGQAYFIQGDYVKAVPHLEANEQRSNRMREEDFYQLGFAQYQIGEYKRAIPNFQQLTKTNSALGQNASYYLGDCFLRTREYNSARTAFKRVSQLDYDKDMQAEAYFNYGKLSAQLGYDREAVNVLSEISTESKYYSESQRMLSDLFIQTGDYKRALEIMDEIENKSPKVKDAYQKVALYRGLQLHNRQDWDGAYDHFEKSLKYPNDASLKSQAYFWMGDIAHRRGNYSGSESLINKYLSAGAANSANPQESAPSMAFYTQGYNHFKRKQWSKAAAEFDKAISGIAKSSKVNDPYILKNVLADAYVKKGDCSFKQNKYDPAIRAYDEAIRLNSTGIDYAKLQKAVILGLKGEDIDKIVLLKEVAEDNPQSRFADDALYELGLTYRDMNKPQEAIQSFKEVINKYGESSNLIVPTLLQLGLLSYNQGAVNEALDYYKRVFDHNPSPEQSQGALAAIQEIYIDDLGDPDGYVSFLESIPNYDISDYEKDSLTFRTAEVKYENGQYEKAIKGFTNYINEYPRGVHKLEAHYRRGDSYTFLKEYSNALEDFEYVIKKGRSEYYERSVKNAALISYNNEEDFDKAYKYYALWEKSAVSEDDKFEAQLGGLRSAYRINKKNEVVRLAELVANNDKASVPQRATARFYLAKVSYDKNDLSTALNAFQYVVDNSNNVQTAESRFRIADIYYKQGNLAQAESAVNYANQNNSAYPYWIARGLILLSDIYSDQGKLSDARAALEAVLENFSEDAGLVTMAEEKLKILEAKEQAFLRIENTPENRLIMDEGNNK